MTATAFVDTNIFLYAHDRTEPWKRERASACLAPLWNDLSGRTSVQVLNEYFVNATQKLRDPLTREEAHRNITALMVWKPVPLDASLLIEARRFHDAYPLSWWDALIIAAAHTAGCHTLLSEDFAAGQTYGRVTVTNPFA